MIDQNFIKDEIDGIQELLPVIKGFKKYSLKEIEDDYHLYASLRYAYIELIERAIDINQHLIKELNGPVPQDYKETFRVLSKLDILEYKFAKSISESVGMRNVVVHEYRDVDDEELYNSIEPSLEQYTQYCQAVLDFLGKE